MTLSALRPRPQVLCPAPKFEGREWFVTPRSDPNRHRSGELGLGTAAVTRKPFGWGAGAHGLYRHGNRISRAQSLRLREGRVGAAAAPRGQGRPQAEESTEAWEPADVGS